MMHYPHVRGRMRYGPGSTPERRDDRDRPSSEQHSEERLRTLAKRYGVNQRAIDTWKKRTSSADPPTGPKDF